MLILPVSNLFHVLLLFGVEGKELTDPVSEDLVVQFHVKVTVQVGWTEPEKTSSESACHLINVTHGAAAAEEEQDVVTC